jgi:hypothetical protein
MINFGTVIVVVVCILITVFMCFYIRYIASDFTQTKEVILTNLSENQVNALDVSNANYDLIPDQFMKCNIRFENTRAKLIKMSIMGLMESKFNIMREQLKKENDIDNRIKIFKKYEEECLKLWRGRKIHVQSLTYDQTIAEIGRLINMKQLTAMSSRSRISQNMFTFKCTIPLGYFYHWDLVDENFSDNMIKTSSFLNSAAMGVSGLKSLYNAIAK